MRTTSKPPSAHSNAGAGVRQRPFRGSGCLPSGANAAIAINSVLRTTPGTPKPVSRAPGVAPAIATVTDVLRHTRRTAVTQARPPALATSARQRRKRCAISASSRALTAIACPCAASRHDACRWLRARATRDRSTHSHPSCGGSIRERVPPRLRVLTEPRSKWSWSPARFASRTTLHMHAARHHDPREAQCLRPKAPRPPRPDARPDPDPNGRRWPPPHRRLHSRRPARLTRACRHSPATRPAAPGRPRRPGRREPA
jgi:hypothetical protein